MNYGSVEEESEEMKLTRKVKRERGVKKEKVGRRKEEGNGGRWLDLITKNCITRWMGENGTKFPFPLGGSRPSTRDRKQSANLHQLGELGTHDCLTNDRGEGMTV